MSEEKKTPSGAPEKSGKKRNRRWGRRRRKPAQGGSGGGAAASGQRQQGGGGQQDQSGGQGKQGGSQRSSQRQQQRSQRPQQGRSGDSASSSGRGQASSGRGQRGNSGRGRQESGGRGRGRRRSSKRRPRGEADGRGKAAQALLAEDREPGQMKLLLPDWEPDTDGEDVLAAVEDFLDSMEEFPEGPVADVACAHVQGSFPVEDIDSGELTLEPGDRVVLSTDRGQVSGTVVTGSVRRVLMDGKLARALRRFDHGDQRQESRNRRKARDAFLEGRERIKARSLPMKLVGVDFLHSGNRAIFYFTAEGRVDFRELIRDLARRLRVRIEMRQIGIRDQAGLVGGMGTCGRPLCCATFLRKFEQVSIRMAKDQNLVLNPQKISGQCGRLKCCLCYEHKLYQEMGKGLPRQGKRVVTPKGRGRVAELDVLRRRVRVMLEDGGYEVFSADEVRRPER